MHFSGDKFHFPNTSLSRWIGWVGFLSAVMLPHVVSGQSLNANAYLPRPQDSTTGTSVQAPGRSSDPVSSIQGQNGTVNTKSYASPLNRQAQSGSSRQSESGLNQDRLDSIQSRIKLLKRLMNEAQVASEIQSSNADKRLADPASPAGEKKIEPLAEAETLPGIAERLAAPSETESRTAPNKKAAIPPPTMSGTPVTTEPINSFELGNSLFLTGNISAARKSYQRNLKQAQSPLEDAWLRCLIGCCYRLEGDLKNAELKFREVTRHKSPSYPGDYAKWSLQYVDRKRKTQEEFLAIESEIETLLKGIQKK